MASKSFNVLDGLSVGPNANVIIHSNGLVSADSLTVSNTSNLGNIGNVKITGGSNGQAITTDGNGNLVFSSISGTGNLAAPMPYYVPTSESYTVSANFQGLFFEPIEIDGALEVDGILIDVSGTSGNGGGGNTLPGGSNTQIQYNDAGAFGGNSTFTFDEVTGVVSVPNVTVTGNIIPSVSNTYSLGNTNNRFNNLYLAGNLEITGNVTTSGTIASSAGTIYPIVFSTAQNTTSGTGVTFSDVPSWVKRITILLNGVSVSGTDDILIQLGTSSGIETTSYVSVSAGINTDNTSGSSSSTTGFVLRIASATRAMSGSIQIYNYGSNIFICSGVVGASESVFMISGTKTLSAALTQIKMLPSGANTFDAGSVNILYE